MAGTHQWMAPEQFNTQTYSYKVDIFAFAIILNEIATNEIPFEKLDTIAIITQLNDRKRPNLASNRPYLITKLIQACWHQDAQQRPEAGEIISTLSSISSELKSNVPPAISVEQIITLPLPNSLVPINPEINTKLMRIMASPSINRGRNNKINKNFKYKSKNEYDFFISYRKSSEQDLANQLYFAINERLHDNARDYPNLNCFVDSKCLVPGENWKEGYKEALKNSSVIIMLISEAAVSSFKKITEQTEDNVLHEWEMAIEYNKTMEKAILPIFVDRLEGANNISRFKFERDYPNVKANNTNITVKEIMNALLDLHGARISEISDEILKKIFTKLANFEQPYNQAKNLT
jgi:hypothetical protein